LGLIGGLQLYCDPLTKPNEKSIGVIT